MVQSSSYSSIPQAVRDLVANKVSLLDQYILFQTGDYEYTALILDSVSRKCEQVRVYRTSGSYSSAYNVAVTEGVWDWSIGNEYYVYSNVGVGAALDLPVVEGVIAHATIIMCVALMFAIVFKGVLFPWSKKRKSR